MKFYVYEWFNIKTNEIFYVGKGCGKRCSSLLHRNKLFVDYINMNECNYRILQYFDNEEDAFFLEHERIIELKKKGQCQCNLDNGGKGGCNFVWTDEMRNYKSQFNPMKESKQRERMRYNNPMKDKSIVEKSTMHKRKPVIIGDKEFNSVIDAAKYFNTSSETIIKWCKKGVNPSFDKCRYKNQKQIEFKGKRYNLGGCKPLRYKDKIYESPIDLARELSLHNSTICNWAKKGFDPQGNICRYLNDNRTITFTNINSNEYNSKAIYVNGILYSSKRQAEIELGLSKGYLAPYIAGTRKNIKYKCEYVNQQPSHKKSKYSIVEGSTTNG